MKPAFQILLCDLYEVWFYNETLSTQQETSNQNTLILPNSDVFIK